MCCLPVFKTQKYSVYIVYTWGFPGGTSDKEPHQQCRRHKKIWVQSLGGEDPLEEGMATHSSILVWRSPWAEEPGGLQSMGSQRVGHDRAHTHACIVYTQYS